MSLSVQFPQDFTSMWTNLILNYSHKKCVFNQSFLFASETEGTIQSHRTYVGQTLDMHSEEFQWWYIKTTQQDEGMICRRSSTVF